MRMAVATLCHLLWLHPKAAHGQDRQQVGKLSREVQKQTGRSFELAYVDQGSGPRLLNLRQSSPLGFRGEAAAGQMRVRRDICVANRVSPSIQGL